MQLFPGLMVDSCTYVSTFVLWSVKLFLLFLITVRKEAAVVVNKDVVKLRPHLCLHCQVPGCCWAGNSFIWHHQQLHESSQPS